MGPFLSNTKEGVLQVFVGRHENVPALYVILFCLPYPAGGFRVNRANGDGGPGHPFLVLVRKGGGDPAQEVLVHRHVGLPAEEAQQQGQQLATQGKRGH